MCQPDFEVNKPKTGDKQTEYKFLARPAWWQIAKAFCAGTPAFVFGGVVIIMIAVVVGNDFLGEGEQRMYPPFFQEAILVVAGIIVVHLGGITDPKAVLCGKPAVDAPKKVESPKPPSPRSPKNVDGKHLRPTRDEPQRDPEHVIKHNLVIDECA